jgi:tRNA A37 methylthiotransferase MiaB
VDGLEWIRLSYLQPAEVKPSLLDAIFGTPKVLPYLDLPVQHASASVLRRMRRFGDPESFLALLEKARSYDPMVGLRSNVIVGFPGETEDDVRTLKDFLAAALRLFRRGGHRSCGSGRPRRGRRDRCPAP